MSDEIREPWASALRDAGFTHPRSKDRPSWNALSRESGVHTSTLTAMAAGSKATRQEVVDAVATALKRDPREVSSWVSRSRSERRAYQAPAEANLLSRDERELVDRIIRALAKSKKGGHDDRTPMTHEHDNPMGT